MTQLRVAAFASRPRRAGWALGLSLSLAAWGLSACDEAGIEGDGGDDSGGTGGGDARDGGSNGDGLDRVADGAADAAAATQVLRFRAQVGDRPFSCDATYEGLGTTGTTVAPLDFRLYVSGVELLTDTGASVPFQLVRDGVWQTNEVAMLDFEDKSGTCANGTQPTNRELRGTVAPGTYRGIQLTIGVPFALNHGNPATAPSPLNLTTMSWSWNTGMKFVRVDVRPMRDGGASVDGGMGGAVDGGDAGAVEGGGAPAGGGHGAGHGGGAFNVHLGSTECMGDAQDGGVTRCGRPNRGAVRIVGVDPFATTFVVDLEALLSGSDVSKDTGGAPGCMSGATDPECPPILERLGVNPASGEGEFATQRFIRAE